MEEFWPGGSWTPGHSSKAWAPLPLVEALTPPWWSLPISACPQEAQLEHNGQIQMQTHIMQRYRLSCGLLFWNRLCVGVHLIKFWQLFIEKKIWMARQHRQGFLAFKHLIYFTKLSKNTNLGQNASGRPWWTSPCKGTWAPWGFLGEMQVHSSRGWHSELPFFSYFPPYIWLLGVPKVMLNASIIFWKCSIPEPSCALAFECRQREQVDL